VVGRSAGTCHENFDNIQNVVLDVVDIERSALDDFFDLRGLGKLRNICKYEGQSQSKGKEIVIPANMFVVRY